MLLKDKAKIIGDVMDHENKMSDLWGGERTHPIRNELVDLIVATHAATHRVGADSRYTEESWGETFIRYHKRGYIKRDVVEEYFCRIVLEGLHNGAD